MSALPPPVLAVGGAVIDFAFAKGDPAVLLVKRGRPPMEGRWSLPGGRVEPGETVAAALAREIVEETGITVRLGPLVEVIEIIEESYHYVILDYACEPAGGALRAGDDAADVAWVPISDLATYGVSKAVLRVVEGALRLVAGSSDT